MARPTPAPDSALVRVDVSSGTDVGRMRDHNEDAFLVADLTSGREIAEGSAAHLTVGERGLLFMVADGMGGAAAGEVASRMAVEQVFDRLRGRTEPWLGQPVAFVAALHDAATHANQAIHAYARSSAETHGMGTTATIAGLLGDTLYLAQVGDSRAYLIRNREARQLTKDQSLIQKLVEIGEISPEDAERSERRNIILQALGPEAEVVVDLTKQQVRRGDVLVLCSDGLSGVVRREDITRTVLAATSPAEACDRLIAQANANGGPDNITAVVVAFDGPGLADARPDDDVGYRVFEQAEQVRTGEMRAVRRPVQLAASAAASGGADPDAAFHRDEERRRRGERWTRLLLVLAMVAAAIYLVLTLVR